MAFYRDHPVTFGLLLSLVGTPILIVAAIRYPSFYDLLFKDPAWTRFAIFTATIFPLAIAYLGPRHGSASFWILMIGIFAVHISLFVVLIHYVRQLTGFDYILYGPFEGLIFVFVIPRVTRMLRDRRPGMGRTPN